MMAFLELNESVEAVEGFDYIEHELSCPFCEEAGGLEVLDNIGEFYYKCVKCGNDWVVIGE